MKKILLILLSFLYINSFAQTLVDTSLHNKNIVLEEFTGIHCTYCPDGHVIAQSIYNAYPQRVSLINVHVGSYAQPSFGEPDFRTVFGSSLSAQSNLSGYPAGTINRHLFFNLSQSNGTAMGRSNWQQATIITLNELSPVNIGSLAQYDTTTGELHIDVEIYYTDTQSVFLNYLNIAITQDSVLGPQVGAQSFNSAAIVPGPWQPTYSHQHMLRHLVTGQWGAVLDPIIPGTFISMRYKWPVPSEINDIPVVIKDLRVVSFITESSQEILNSTETPVTILPQPVSSIYEIIPTINDGVTYDIFGRVVKQTKKGVVYIKNNKKFIKF
tara:strand:- start:435 stop:1412 length:978 start_codon:yes stop_codon:yes gene_type:complete